jgi:hypothetical protein
MKTTTLTVIVAAGMLAAGTAFAGNGQGPRGQGYGGPPQSEEERAARQEACAERNGGVCPQDGPRQDCQGNGRGQGQGNRFRRGARDGSGPRGGSADCPLNKNAAQR